ncbi:MAG: hypothetical protein ABI640_13005 [Gammaproteobacteria bacterium]
MARGGYRPGAGRPKGTKNRPKVSAAPASPSTAQPGPAAAAASDGGTTPLDYMLKVMRDPEIDEARRDKMAIAAAPFLHPRPTETGKKEQKREKARDLLQGGGNFAPAQTPLGLHKMN